MHLAGNYVLNPAHRLGNLFGAFPLPDDNDHNASSQVKSLFLRQFHNCFSNLLRAHIQTRSETVKLGKRIRLLRADFGLLIFGFGR